jgi:hypothetical protein
MKFNLSFYLSTAGYSGIQRDTYSMQRDKAGCMGDTAYRGIQRGIQRDTDPQIQRTTAGIQRITAGYSGIL